MEPKEELLLAAHAPPPDASANGLVAKSSNLEFRQVREGCLDSFADPSRCVCWSRLLSQRREDAADRMAVDKV